MVYASPAKSKYLTAPHARPAARQSSASPAQRWLSKLMLRPVSSATQLYHFAGDVRTAKPV